MKATEHRDQVREAFVEALRSQTIHTTDSLTDTVVSAIMTTGGVEALVAERDGLRAALIQSGRSAGAGLSDDVSSDFLSHVPDEVALKVERLTNDVAMQLRSIEIRIEDEVRAKATQQHTERLLFESEARVAELTAALEEIRDLNGTPCSRRSVAIARQALVPNKVGEG